MSKSTPGPWEAERDAAGEDFYSHLIEGKTCTVAGVTGIGEAEAWANARLIAAAPELLEALKAMIGIDNPAAPDLGHVDYVRAVAMGRKAIAKAEGK